MYIKCTCCLCLIAAPTIYANENNSESYHDNHQITNPLTFEVEFGYRAHSGNTESESLNIRLASEYIKGRHRTNSEWTYYQFYKNSIEDNNRHRLTLQSDYKLNQQGYSYSYYNGLKTRHSAYFEDHTISIGLGYQLINRDLLEIQVEAGPGYRYQKPNIDKIQMKDVVFPTTIKEAILRTNTSFVWQPLESTQFGGNWTAIAGKSNTRFDTELNITNSITQSAAFKIVYNNIYHDKVPENRYQKDNILSFNLLFLLD